MSNIYEKRRFSLGLLVVFATLAFIFTGCTDEGSDPEPTKYTVTFNVDGGSVVPNQTVEIGKTVTKPADPTKAGHTFANWYKDESKTILWDFTTDVVVQNTTIHAKWVSGENVQSYTVTFNTDGGSTAPAEQTVVSGEPVAKPADPTKEGYIFSGWYNGQTPWDFSTGITQAITLTAHWTEAFTVTFNTSGGATIAPLTVAKDSSVNLYNYTPSKDGNIFDGWYTDAALTTLAEYDLTVTESLTLYAKWTSTSELADYVGVWRSGDGAAYLLQDDGTSWHFSSYFYKSSWSPSQIGGAEVTFNEEKTEFTFTSYGTTYTYTKNTTEKKTPAPTTGDLLGVWANGSRSVELKDNGDAVLTDYSNTITLKYCVEASAVYVLTSDNNNLVISSIDIQEGKLANLSKLTSDTSLAGIWKLTENGQDYYWNFKADGSGTFHALGASVPFSFIVTEDGKIDGYSYTVSGDTLTLPEAGEDEEGHDVDVVLSKAESVPAGSGAGGDARLHGAWKMTQGGQTITLTFNDNGSLEQKQGDSSISDIWKADGSNLYLYDSGFGARRGTYPMPYTVSGSTLTLKSGNSDMVLTK
jgi:uncharacterized repeat protein (TIGR02543 family)